jgi:aspartyl-tRNA(Asn)/glutamyl-tRNA(Gln) amidotransferase subunit A
MHRRSDDPARPLAGITIGLPREYFGEGTAPDVLAAVHAALDQYRKLGAETVEISLSNVNLSVPVYYVIAPAEASSNLSRFDGVRYGHRAAQYDDLLDMYKENARRRLRRRGQAPDPDRHVRAVGGLLRRVLPEGATGAPADRRRPSARVPRRRRHHGPTAPSTAFPFGDKSDDPVKMYLNDIFTIAANLAGLPAMSIPCGFDDKDCRSACTWSPTTSTKRRC